MGWYRGRLQRLIKKSKLQKAKTAARLARMKKNATKAKGAVGPLKKTMKKIGNGLIASAKKYRHKKLMAMRRFFRFTFRKYKLGGSKRKSHRRRKSHGKRKFRIR